MSVRIRLKRVGRKKKPIYRIVVSDSREPRDGKTIEQLGLYDPLKGEIALKVDMDRIKYWIESGAKPSHTARNLLKRQGFYKWYHELRFGPQGEAEQTPTNIQEIEVGGKKVTIEKKSSKQKKRERLQAQKETEKAEESEKAEISSEEVSEPADSDVKAEEAAPAEESNSDSEAPKQEASEESIEEDKKEG